MRMTSGCERLSWTLFTVFTNSWLQLKLQQQKKNTDTKATIKKLENLTLKLFDLDVQRLNQGLSKKRPEIWIGYFSTDEYFQ